MKLIRLLIFAIVAVSFSLQAAATAQPAKPYVRALSFSPDGKLLVAGFGSKDAPGGIACWEVASRRQLWKRLAPTGVNSVKFAPDGQSIAIAQWKPMVVRLNPTNGVPLGEIGPHPANVQTVAFVQGGELLAVGGGANIQLWDVKTGVMKKELKGHAREVTSLVASPDGRWLISSATADKPHAWDVPSGQELKDVLAQGRGNAYRGIAFFRPDWLIAGDDSDVQRIIELPTGREILRFRSRGGCDGAAYSSSLGLAAFRRNYHNVVAIADLTFRPPSVDEQAQIDKILKDFDDDSYAVREAASAAIRKIGSVAETALRRAMVDGSSPEVRMRAREVRQLILDEPIRTLKGHSGSVGAMAFSTDGQILATGADDGTIRLWDPVSGQELARLDVPGN